MKKKLNLILSIALLGILFSCMQMKNNEPLVKVKALAINITPDKVSMEVDQTKQLKTIVIPSDANETILWSSLSPEVARVSPQGLVTSLKEGEAIITAKAGDKSSTALITVENIVLEPLEYCIPEASFKKYAEISEISLNGEELYGDSDGVYTELIDQVINISGNETTLIVEVDQANTTVNDKFILAAYIDWNLDGDFKDADEEVLMEGWAANGVKRFETKISIPKNAESSSRIRVAFYFDGGTTSMKNGCGIMDSGDVKDFTYKITH
ncbi:MAG: Ig-like domain-containing protein [Marinifilaceae bacterium]